MAAWPRGLAARRAEPAAQAGLGIRLHPPARLTCREQGRAWAAPPAARPPHNQLASCCARRDEGTFELSLCAEALHEALVRDAGAAIVTELYAHR